MFKNTVLKASVDTKKWIKGACMRAIYTFAETAIGFIVVGSRLSDIDWIMILSVSCTATIVSILKSVIAGIPEVEADE